MKRALAAIGTAIAVGLCIAGVLRHRPRRVFALGGFRCERCGRVGEDLDDLGELGAGYVTPNRPVFSRDGAGGRAETTRSGEWPS